MIKSRFRYLKLPALIAVFAMTLVPNMRTSATGRLSPTVTGVDLSGEERLLARYFDDLVAYDKQAAQLGKQARLVNSDLEGVQKQSDDLKARLSEVQNAVREIVRKLKAAGEWDELDTNIVARITDQRDKSYFQQNSLKKLLEDNSSSLTNYRSDISEPLDNLRRKVASRTFSPYGDPLFVRAAYEPSVPFTHLGLQCVISNIQVGLVWRLGGAENTKHQNQRICSCSGGTAATCSNATT